MDDFLEEQGYDRIDDDQGKPDRNYESREGGLVELFYFAKAPKVKKGEVPDWERNGYKVTCELMVSTKEDAEEVEEAERIAHEATRRYNGVLYDPQENTFSMSPNRN